MKIKKENCRYYLTLMKGKLQISVCIHLPTESTDTAFDAVFLLHSLHGCKLGPNDMFPYIGDRLCEAGICCIRFDYIGRGESSWRQEVNIESQAEDVRYVVDKICQKYKINHISLVSISNSASLIFYLDDIIDRINSVVLLSPVFLHIEGIHKSKSLLNVRLNEYAQKLLFKQTYMKLIRCEIDIKSIFQVIRKSRCPEKTPPKVTSNRSRLKNIKRKIGAIPSLLVIGSQDPHCRKNLTDYQTFIRKNRFNWDTNILEGAGHNFTSREDRERVAHLIYNHINEVEDR